MTEATKSIMTPFDVQGKPDYDKITNQFGASKITPELLTKIEEVTNEPVHPFLKNGIFYSHRDFDKVLEMHKRGKPFYLYTGRGPSSKALHLGHMIPFMFTAYLQRVFDVQCVIQITDDEKYLFKDLTLDKINEYATENIKDIIACGFNPEKTFIFRNTQYMGTMYPLVLQLQKFMSGKKVKQIFGLSSEKHNIGQIAFPAIQAAPSFSHCFPHLFNGRKDIQCVIPCAVDQDPYFRLTRDFAPKFRLPKPALLHSVFLPPLSSMEGKMSASGTMKHTIYMTDTANQIKKKINKAASGGRVTLEEHMEMGADLEIDVAYHYLKYFISKKQYDEITLKYGSGEMLTGEVKKMLIGIIVKLTKDHQEKRQAITDDVMKQFLQ
jgi:tryptophanyl-tRNA synthetase